MCQNSSSRIVAALLVAVALVSVRTSSAADQSLRVKPLVAKTKQGKVAGKQEGEGVRAFLGIPYAAPPVGALRWKAPMPAAKWKGVRDAAAFGNRCMQPAIYSDMVFRDPGVSEDCLTLNVWTPAKAKGERLPVMVWIYGGGFIAGTTSETRQDGAALATNGVVVVSMNYRLGIFGFMALPELTAESAHHSSGNYGLLDQTAALGWVKENIAAFGGDPGNVTIFGESAGAFSVSAQMASPLAKGLFEKVIGESGAAFSSQLLPFKPRSEIEQRDAAFAHDGLSADSLEQLRAIPARQLMELSRKPGAPDFAPDIDGYLLPESVPAIFAAGKQNDVPLLAGYNRDEGGIDPKTTVASFQKDVSARFGDHAPEILKLYPAADDAQAVRSAADLAGDRFIAFSTWKWMEAQSATGKQPVYRYRFDLAPPADPNHPGGLAAYHSGEIPYVFGDLHLLHGFAWRPEDRLLSQQMQRYWTNFAKTGDPNGEGLPKWPVYKADSGWKVMYLDAQPMAENDRTRARDLLLDSIGGR
jgi:para-nitrobenzyl esterase